MVSGFVSGGTIEAPIERDAEWIQAQKDIEDARRKKEEIARQHDGKTLYEVLQSNKAAKEEAFQESAKLKNQFRHLADDEVEFLDAVLESTRAKEDAVRKETSARLDEFRQQQEAADRENRLLSTNSIQEGAKEERATDTPGDWAVSARKRRRTKESENSSDARGKAPKGKSVPPAALLQTKKADNSPEDQLPKDQKLSAGGKNINLGLDDYDSDED